MRSQNTHKNNKEFARLYRQSIEYQDTSKGKSVYPVILREGKVLFGLFEVMFDQPAFYNYKACRIQEKTKAHVDERMVETYFIRKRYWQHIARDERNFKIMHGFKLHTLMAYLKFIHIPVSLATQEDMGII